MNILLLLKNNLFQSLFIENRKNKNQNQYKSLIILLILVLGFSFYYNFIISVSFILTNTLNLYLLVVVSIAQVLCFFTTFPKFESQIFACKDYEMLESMPFKRHEIIISKVLSLYLFDLLEDLIIIVPAIIFNIAFKGSITLSLITFLLIFFIPLLPIAISGLLSYVITIITSRLKHKNVLRIILYLIVFFAIWALSFISGLSEGSENSEEVVQLYSKLFEFNPFMFFINKIYDGNYIHILYFILVSLASFILIVYAVSLGYHKINNFMLNAKVHNKYKKGDKTKYSLFKKDMHLITSKPNLFVAAFITPLMAAILMIIMIISQEALKMSYLVGFSMLIFIISMSVNSSWIISVEGPFILQLKSLPIKEKDIFKSKCFASAIFLLVPSLIGVIVSNIIYFQRNGEDRIYFLIFSILIIIAQIVYQTFLGLLCDLKWAKINYTSSTEFKAGKAYLVGGLISFATSLVTLISLVLLSIVFGSVYGLIATLIINVSASILCFILLKLYGKELYKKI